MKGEKTVYTLGTNECVRESTMDLSNHNLPNLFAQLGISNSHQDIEKFVKANKGISSELKLHQAPFWNESQSSFLCEAIAEDSDWSEIVDTLDTLLR